MIRARRRYATERLRPGPVLLALLRVVSVRFASFTRSRPPAENVRAFQDLYSLGYSSLRQNSRHSPLADIQDRTGKAMAAFRGAGVETKPSGRSPLSARRYCR